MLAGGILIRNARVGLEGIPADVRIRSGIITEVHSGIAKHADEREFDARGGALLPGLHDHHLHVLSLVASMNSVQCGPAHVGSLEQLGAALRAAMPDGSGSVRGVGYVESVAGELTRGLLDSVTGDVPVRIMHRSGALWMYNTAALERYGMFDERVLGEGVERDVAGVPNGRFWRADAWLGTVVSSEQVSLSQLAQVGAELASLGIVGVTDATVSLSASAQDLFARAMSSGALPQRVQLLAAEGPLVEDPPPGLSWGPAKYVIGDHGEADLQSVIDAIRSARAAGRAVAIHTVSLESFALLMAAFAQVPAVVGDRIEHAAVVPHAMLDQLASLGVSVVTQPGFIADRGDELSADLGEDWEDSLYRLDSIRRIGVGVALSSDAPYGPLSPWVVMQAAATRVAPNGAIIGAAERVDARYALERYLSPLDQPGAPARELTVGAPADLVLLHHPLEGVWSRLPNNPVRMTLINGEAVWSAPGE